MRPNNQTVISISIEVNEMDGNASTTSSGDTERGWGNMANRIKDVVHEEIFIQKHPGGMLYQDSEGALCWLLAGP